MEKCTFHQTLTQFLGYIISSDGFMMDPDKLKAVTNWPRPDSLKSVQRFLGFANYFRKFIRDFSRIVAPITALTKKGADPSVWSPEANTAFNTLKEAFVSAPVLHHPNTDLPFVLEVDASDSGAGAILS
ncbi:uncharacterized protein LOC142493625 [Ascaphus truei]|uniref:uncharacterized protein LOC142493625 n=1 Tax=Ascaphus truei TaxID=8439 RepID=UPI003F59BC4C